MTSKSTTEAAADPWTDLNVDDAELQNLLDKPLPDVDNSRLRDGEQHLGFDSSLGDSWIYPSNMPCRSYQLSIVQAALYRNTLVVLPTGLGKTFIAAVVMYNIYRWYPRGKVIFMAPTRPLVNQQIEACQKIMPFPRNETVEMTGKIPKAKRAEMWRTKRVFFATPHVVQSDILGGQVQADDEESAFDNSTTSTKTDFPFDSIKLIVIDEAHKAKGKYAYTLVSQAIAARTKYFRVLALSATPGRTMEDVAEVCRNLMISHLEVRWDTSIDVMPYVHKRHMETVVVPFGDRIKEVREELLLIIDPYLRQLTDCQVLSGSLANINRNFLVFEQKRYQERSQHNNRHPQHSAITSNFSICISLYHALELLDRHGTRVFLNYFEEDEDGKAKFVIQIERRLRALVDKLKEKVGSNPFDISAGPMTNGQIAQMPRDLDFGHPKFEKARESLLKHFEIHEESRAIVFCEYRESVLLIYRMLLQHVPLLRPRCFVGQGGTGSLRALTQKNQIQIMNDFRSGKSNILIATSIGEEGIDVGEVDLIVCFDISSSNPTRFVQRIGRTGRQKAGKVIMIVTEGREQQILKEVLSNKDQANKKLLRSTVVQQALYKHAPRLVPTEFKPQCIQTYITPCADEATDEEDSKTKNVKSKKSSKNKTPVKGTQDLRKFFNKKPQPIMDAEDMEYFEIDTKMTQAKPGVLTQQNMRKSLDHMKNLFKDLQSPAPTQAKSKLNIKPNNSLTDTNGPIDLCDDSPENSVENADVTPGKCKKINQSQGSIKDFFKDCTDSTKIERNSMTPGCQQDQQWTRLTQFLQKNFTTADVLKRAQVNDLTYHLKSKEMSNDMKYVLLTQRPEFIRENLDQMKVLNAVIDLDSSSESSEEKSIREIHTIIVDVFQNLVNAEKFLEDNEMQKYKQECLANEISSDEDASTANEQKFTKTLDVIFTDLGQPLQSSDTYEWIQQRFKETEKYKTIDAKSKIPAIVQESMVYSTLVEAEEPMEADDPSENHCEEMSFIDSKYCSQWQEFNKPDIAFKSTPLPEAINSKCNRRGFPIKRSSLLTKLEEESNEKENEVNVLSKSSEVLPVGNGDGIQNLNGSNKFLQSLKLCEKSLNLLLEQRKQDDWNSSQISPRIGVQDDNTSTTSDSNLTTGSLAIFEIEDDLHSTKNNNKTLRNCNNSPGNVIKTELQKMDEDDEEVLYLAALEAELKFTQTKAKEVAEKEQSTRSKDTSNELNSTSDNAVPALENLNSSVNITPPSLNSTPDIADFQLIPQGTIKLNTALPTPPEISIHHELDLDMEAFMEPFPEEQELLKSANKSLPARTIRRESFKENLCKDLFVRESPDLFAEDRINTPKLLLVKPLAKKTSLASKLAAKTNVQRCHSDINPSVPKSSPFKSPHKLLIGTRTGVQLTSPTSRLPTDNSKNDKSPSLFDMYLKNSKGKVKLPKSLGNTSSSLAFSRSTDVVTETNVKDAPALPCSQADSPVIVRKRGASAPKRKIFDSETEESGNESRNDLTVIEVGDDEGDEDSDFEEVAATQAAAESSIHYRRKRRRFNSFIEHEAAVSGSDESEEDAEHSIGCYLLDSMVVPSDDEDEDQASTSHMQAMYLQSVKSPQNRRCGTFKIPAPRVYNDHSRIFSQALGPEETCSQYMPDSFIVDEDSSYITNNANELSMCPLEKAEKILKERRKAKKREMQAQLLDAASAKLKAKRRKKAQLIDDSSDDEFE